MSRFVSFYKRCRHLHKAHFNLFKTIILNFRVFPFKDAIRLPVYIYGKVVLEKIHRGCIKAQKIKPHILSIGGGKFTDMFGYSQLSRSLFRCAGTLIVGNDIIIDQGCRISISKKAVLTLGSNIYMNRDVTIHVKQSISIGDNSRVGWSCQIIDSNFHYCLHKGTISKITAPIILNNNVWLANNVAIGKGVVLPPFFIVAARSLVNKDFSGYEGHCLIGGIPAKIISTDISRLLGVEKKLDKVFADGREFVSIDEVKDLIN